MKAFLTLYKIEQRMVIRSIDTLFFGIGFPAVTALFIGILIKDRDVLNSMFSAISTIGICATGLMGLPLAISDYRHRKILKRYSVTPMSPMMILFAHVVINYMIALLSLIVVYFIMSIGFQFVFDGDVWMFFVTFTLITCSMFAVGMMIAGVSPNLKTANLLCTIIYFPMIFLSGTVVPYELMPDLLKNIMDVSPLTQGINLLNHYAFQIQMDTTLPFILLILIALVSFVISIKTFKWV